MTTTKMKYLTLIFMVFLLSISSCHLFNSPDKLELPPITMVGKNTFGCLINGKVWLPKGNHNVPAVNLSTAGMSLSWGARTESDGFIFFLKSPILINHSYDLRDTTTVRVSYTDSHLCWYEIYQIHKGTLIISKYEPGVFAGTFSFDDYNPSCSPDTLKVTEGRFDLF